MDFDIYITEGGRHYKVKVRKLSEDKQFESFEINTSVNSVTVQSNRPMLRAKKLKSKYPNYTIVTGTIRFKKTFDKICEAITNAMDDGIPKPPPSKPIPSMGSKLARLRYNTPKREKGESYEGYEQRCKDHEAEFIKRNWDLLQRME